MNIHIISNLLPSSYERKLFDIDNALIFIYLLLNVLLTIAYPFQLKGYAISKIINVRVSFRSPINFQKGDSFSFSELGFYF